MYQYYPAPKRCEVHVTLQGQHGFSVVMRPGPISMLMVSALALSYCARFPPNHAVQIPELWILCLSSVVQPEVIVLWKRRLLSIR